MSLNKTGTVREQFNTWWATCDFGEKLATILAISVCIPLVIMIWFLVGVMVTGGIESECKQDLPEQVDVTLKVEDLKLEDF